MQQSLENVISKLQKIYQLKALELEHIREDLELRKIATALANFKDSDELASYDKEKIKTFLTKSGSNLNLEAVSLACTIVDLANSVVKTSKRYMEASAIIETIREEAITFIEEKEDLFLKETQCENALQTMENLFNVLTNKVVVSADNLDIYIQLLESEVFKDDKYSVLVVVAALVIRNATLLSHPDKVVSSQEEIVELNYVLNKRQSDKKEFYENFVNKLASLYDSKHRGMVTNTYLKNIELLIEKKKIDFEEAKTMLNSDSNLYEYFIWNWMSKLVDKVKRASSSREVNNIINQLDKLKERYDEAIERHKISNLVKNRVNNTRALIYQVDKSPKNKFFNAKDISAETLALLKQLKEGKDTNKMTNITSLDNDLLLLMGENEFILFRKMPKNHTLVLLNGLIEDMDKKLDAKMLELITHPNFFDEIRKIISENGVEYRKIMQASEALETKIFKKDN